MARAAGTKNRNYPPVGLSEALRVPAAIEDQASGMPVSRLTLADMLDLSPSSSGFRALVAASRLYDLTTGGVHSEEFGLTELGLEAAGADEVARVAAYKKAVLNIAPYKAFFEATAGKKVPGSAAFKEFLVRNGGVPAERAEECMSFILADAETAHMIRTLTGSDYVDLSGFPAGQVAGEPESDEDDEPEDDVSDEEQQQKQTPPAALIPLPAASGKPKKVFIAHGKNRTPLEQLKKALDQFKVSYAVAVDEPNKGRPISKKVANLMKDDCSSGIFIFTADERFLREKDDGETEEVWRPSENVVYELGAASMLYDNRIVIFKEKGVSFPTDFSDLGYIEFEKDQLVAEIGSLFTELVGLDILEVRAKS